MYYVRVHDLSLSLSFLFDMLPGGRTIFMFMIYLPSLSLSLAFDMHPGGCTIFMFHDLSLSVFSLGAIYSGAL